jgi:hypothetical protein
MDIMLVLLIIGIALFVIGVLLFPAALIKIARLAIRKQIGLMKRWRWRPARPERVFKSESH